LHHPAHQQHRQVGRDCTYGRASHEDADACQPGALAPVAVADQACRQHEGRQAKRVGVDHPLQPGEIDAERNLDRRQGDVDDADVEQCDECAEIDGGNKRQATVRHETQT
jgi:hypothetical protein